MATQKQKAREPTFYDFVKAVVFDPPTAQSMLRENSSWLSAANSVGETALAYVVIENYLDAARFLLIAGADVNTRDMSEATPLIRASELGLQEMVTLLLESGADVNAEDDEQETALFKAVRYGHVEICEALIAGGSRIQGHNDMEEHLSDVVLPRKREKVLSLLLRTGYVEPAPANRM